METICSPKRRFRLALHGTKSQEASLIEMNFVQNLKKMCLIITVINMLVTSIEVTFHMSYGSWLTH
jgi:hypothetical protein